MEPTDLNTMHLRYAGDEQTLCGLLIAMAPFGSYAATTSLDEVTCNTCLGEVASILSREDQAAAIAAEEEE